MRAGQLALLILTAAAVGCSSGEPQWWPWRQPADRSQMVASRQDVATLEEGVALASKLDYDAAAVKFGEVLPRFEATGDDKRAAEAAYWLGFCREKQGRPLEARELYERVVGDYGRQPAARHARRRLEGLTPAP
jgi:TolA-binding protein